MMRTLLIAPPVAILAVVALGLGACADAPTAATPDLQVESEDFVLDRRAPAGPLLHRLFLDGDRRELGQGLAHYQFGVRLGPDVYDVVRIHRVVRERKPNHPVRTDAGVFMVGGSGQTFEAIFLTPGIDEPDPLTSVPAYLAANEIDVWGIDLSFTQVPADLGDVSFMADWGVERDVDHTLAAMSIARLIRLRTGQGVGRLQLLGFSYGGAVAYAAAGRETQQPRRWRDIGGIVPVDFGIKTADEDLRAQACASVAAIRQQLADGTYRSDVSGAHTLARLALDDPGATSPVFGPPFTNFQAALFVGTNPGAFWHFVGVDFAPSGLPAGLLYSDPVRWFGALEDAGSHPLRANLDIGTSRCNEEETSIDDHLSEISVPILYLGAGGGFGDEGLHSLTLTGSDDITVRIVTLQPAVPRAIDFGHADLFIGDDASVLAWEPLRGWLAAHDRPMP